MKLDGFGILVKDMPVMVRFYRDVLGFEIKEAEDTKNVFLEKDGTLFLMYGRQDFEKMANRSFGYADQELQKQAIDNQMSALLSRIEKIEKHMAEREKMAMSFGVMGGLLLVILLL